MKVIKKGNFKIDWQLEVECTGAHWLSKSRPCHSVLLIEDGDIVKRRYNNGKKSKYAYGFVCCECKNFTEIPEERIPPEIRQYCLEVASRGSDRYYGLSDREKLLSSSL